MTFHSKKEPVLLLVGDIVSFYLALWTMLLVRFFSLPSKELWEVHAVPFSILLFVWLTVYFIAGLYEKHTLILKSKIGSVILNAQITNSVIAFLFFYLIPYFGITPKTNLFVFLILSFFFTLGWRLWLYSHIEGQKKQNAIIIGTGTELKELEQEVNNNTRYELSFISSVDLDRAETIDFQKEIVSRMFSEEVSIVAVDFKNEKVEPFLPQLYNLIFSGVKFIDMHKVYEDIFDRIPLSLVKYSWFLENISTSAQKGYDIAKRAMDIILSTVLGTISLIVYPLVWVAIKIDDQGPLFFIQERIGQNNSHISIIKFRSLPVHTESDGMSKVVEPTRTGRFIRKTRIDELPQLWNVFRGDLSMIGPRPEIPALVKLYEKEIPYYNIRHLIKPGLSGWAQLYHTEPPKFAAQVSETKKKLSYDLFYIKNRSLILDIKVALRTMKILLSREGI